MKNLHENMYTFILHNIATCHCHLRSSNSRATQFSGFLLGHMHRYPPLHMAVGPQVRHPWIKMFSLQQAYIPQSEAMLPLSQRQ